MQLDQGHLGGELITGPMEEYINTHDVLLREVMGSILMQCSAWTLYLHAHAYVNTNVDTSLRTSSQHCMYVIIIF